MRVSEAGSNPACPLSEKVERDVKSWPNWMKVGGNMKKIIEEKEGEGFEKLLGETITVFCANYIYTGKLTGVNETTLLLTDPMIVYETGSFSDKKEWYILINAIESFGVLK